MKEKKRPSPAAVLAGAAGFFSDPFDSEVPLAGGSGVMIDFARFVS